MRRTQDANKCIAKMQADGSRVSTVVILLGCKTFLPTELNEFRLIDNYMKAYDIKKKLLENNPEEHHADTNVIAVWRHNKIGRQNENK